MLFTDWELHHVLFTSEPLFYCQLLDQVTRVAPCGDLLSVVKNCMNSHVLILPLQWFWEEEECTFAPSTTWGVNSLRSQKVGNLLMWHLFPENADSCNCCTGNIHTSVFNFNHASLPKIICWLCISQVGSAFACWNNSVRVVAQSEIQYFFANHNCKGLQAWLKFSSDPMDKEKPSEAFFCLATTTEKSWILLSMMLVASFPCCFASSWSCALYKCMEWWRT